MVDLNALTTVATIVSGAVSLTVLVSIIVDAFTRGWIRGHVQSYVGISDLRKDHQMTQIFLLDIGDRHNKLKQTVCEEHDIPEDERPSNIAVDRYDLLQNRREDGPKRGDFVREDGGWVPGKSD